MIDLPLTMTALLFLGLGFIYGWGILNIKIPAFLCGNWQRGLVSMRDNFSWSLASVWGIAMVVSSVYVFVWEVRGIFSPLQAVIDLAIVFLAALPGMTWVDYELQSDKLEQVSELERRNLELSTIIEEKNQTREQVKLILLEQKETKQMLVEVLQLLSLRQEAIQILESRRN